MSSSLPRCPWAIAVGFSLATRCHKPAGHVDGDLDATHEGPGLAEFPYQRVSWFAGDRREFETDRDEPHAWGLS